MNLHIGLLIISFILLTLSDAFKRNCLNKDCITTITLSADTCELEKNGFYHANSSHPQHSIQFAQMKNRLLKTPRCFLNPLKGSGNEYIFICYCESSFGEACESKRSRGEALYQWKRNEESNDDGSKKSDVAKKVTMVDCALDGIEKLENEMGRVEYTIDLTTCGSPPTFLSSPYFQRTTNLTLRFGNNMATVVADFSDAKLLLRNIEELNDIVNPIRIIRGLIFKGKLNQFSDHLGDAQCVLKSLWRLVQRKTSLAAASGTALTIKKIASQRLKHDMEGGENRKLAGTSVICWILMFFYILPVTGIIVAAVIREDEEPRTDLPEDPEQYLPDVEDILIEQFPPPPSGDSPLSSKKKSKGSEIVDIAISMQFDPNHTDLGSHATGDGVVVAKNVSPEPVTPKEDQIF